MQSMTAFPFTSILSYDEHGWPVLDRAVGSETLRKVLQNYYTNGVFVVKDSTSLQVTAPASGGGYVQVRPGSCLINGATGYIDEQIELDLTAGDTSLPRIDTVVARLNDNSDYRNIYLDILIGTPASTPVAPTLTQTDSIWEIGLANIYRSANSTVVTPSNITDTRLDTTRCGPVTAIQEIDTEALMQQLNAYYDEFVERCEDDYNASRADYLAQCNALVQQITDFNTATEAEILAWFDGMKDQLSEDAAIHLQTQINAINENDFLEKYGLVNKVASIIKNTEGITTQIVETSTDDSVIATTTFTRNAEGSTTQITTDVVPAADTFHYVKTVVFETLDGNGSKRITESYSKIAKS